MFRTLEICWVAMHAAFLCVTLPLFTLQASLLRFAESEGDWAYLRQGAWEQLPVVNFLLILSLTAGIWLSQFMRKRKGLVS